MEKVIFDTQIVRNAESKQFLGGRRELEKFAKVAELVFPDIVIEEIKQQKKRSLASKKQSFLDNPFHWLRNLDHDETKRFDIEAHLKDLEDEEELDYTVIQLTDYSVLEQMKELALKKLPPFDAGDNTDKGFKDACIYFTVLEYLQRIPDKLIFVCCKDGRLKEAFKKHLNITVIENFDEFVKNSITIFYDDYFIDKLKTEIHAEIVKESILGYWSNINDNHVLLIEVEGKRIVVEVDSGEIIAYREVDDYSTSIINLINSSSFSDTHFGIESLNPYLHFLSDDEIISVLEATVDNGQIGSIVSDDDVKQFISTLYEKKKGMLAPELEVAIKERLG